uniref:Uncharacterized protein n=1 Tax=candidate division WWE3 bacterium TaxID=2053526 RepID=A0A7C4XMF8_UNCKA
MKKLTPQQKEKLRAALELLCEESTSLTKANKIAVLLKGLSPTFDLPLQNLMQIISKIQKVQGGDVITLSAEKLPENTQSEKDRKKLLLLFLTNWKQLKSEVERVSALHAEITSIGEVNSTGMIKIGKLLTTMKGPLGLITILAAGIVALNAFLNSHSVSLNIKNVGCRPIGPFTQQAVNLPGLKLPKAAILDGEEQMAQVLALDFVLDTKLGGMAEVSFLGQSKDLSIPSDIKDITYDGRSLIGKRQNIKLSSAKTHDIVVTCVSARPGVD